MKSVGQKNGRAKFFVPLIAIVWLSCPASADTGEIDFNRDVRPILANYCFRCHGFDAKERQAELRLDVREDVLRELESGNKAIIPHHPDESELVVRITSEDDSLRMPPLETNQKLDEAQTKILRQWITEGAAYKQHWAFEPVTRPPVPNSNETLNPIDAFVGAKLKSRGLDFAPEGSPEVLLRRISFDLTGLPPTLDDLARFRTEGYEKTVDRLMASPHYGERMAVDWLDAARYADTNGYFGDTPRDIWLWRDWVIGAFNTNMPYDQFTIEQIAGDLLPDATIQQRIATGFNRNHMSNNETGIIEEEYRVEYVIDRLDTTMTTWMGLTVGCAQCHDHKYDPITQREFYQLFAFFNTVDERGLLVGNNAPPLISLPTPEQQSKLSEATRARTAAEQEYEPLQEKTVEQIQVWEPTALATLPPSPTDSVLLHEPLDGTFVDDVNARGKVPDFESGVLNHAAAFDGTQDVTTDLKQFKVDEPWTIGFWLKPDGPLSGVLSKIESEDQRRGLEILWGKGKLNVHLVHRWKTSAIEISTKAKLKTKQWQHVAITYDGSRKARGLKVYIDGNRAPLEVASDSLSGSIETTQPLKIGRRDAGLGYYGSLDELYVLEGELSEDTIASWSEGERIRGILLTVKEKRTSQQSQILFDHYLDHHGLPETKRLRNRIVKLRKEERAAREAIPTTLVMAEQTEPRKTFVLERGQYDHPTEEVNAGVPTSLSSWPREAPHNRLGLAHWLVAKENPLTARVAVNRLWKQCFGEGLVRTMNDFGTQGELPTHPELLDFLAAEFRNNGWNVKQLLRLIVTSRTYRQSSQLKMVNGEVFDPENRLLSRGSSFRLPMEMIRDQALLTSGLLVDKIGGPSVKPYQPPGLWREVSYNGEQQYTPGSGSGLYRRSLYTFIKRQAPPPSMLLLDGPTREKCTIQRPETNTPLQALLLLNDDIYIEASRKLAQSVLLKEEDDDRRMVLLWRKILTRNPTVKEHQVLQELLNRQRKRFQSNPEAAEKILSVGESESDSKLNHSELAAWTIVAHTVFNLDEAIVRR